VTPTTTATLNETAATVAAFRTGPSRAASDFTPDLRSDILWRHAAQGDLWLWPMDGNTRQAESYVRTVADTTWEIRALGDQNGDGTADLLWRNRLSGQIYWWPMKAGRPQDEIYVATVDPAYDIVGTGDFDGDGKADILWRHTALGDVWVWLMDGAASKPGGQVYIDRVDPGYEVKGIRDLDGNGKADIVWHHAIRGEVWVWPDERDDAAGPGLGWHRAGHGVSDPRRGGRDGATGRPIWSGGTRRAGSVGLDDERHGARGGNLGCGQCPTRVTGLPRRATTTAAQGRPALAECRERRSVAVADEWDGAPL